MTVDFEDGEIRAAVRAIQIFSNIFKDESAALIDGDHAASP